jgi:hypothetical protein
MQICKEIKPKNQQILTSLSQTQQAHTQMHRRELWGAQQEYRRRVSAGLET